MPAHLTVSYLPDGLFVGTSPMATVSSLDLVPVSPVCAVVTESVAPSVGRVLAVVSSVPISVAPDILWVVMTIGSVVIVESAALGSIVAVWSVV